MLNILEYFTEEKFRLFMLSKAFIEIILLFWLFYRQFTYT